jgi:hypothetical protein
MGSQQRQDRQAKSRPFVSLRLEAREQQVDGEILLDDLTKIAEMTQKFVRQIARSMVGRHGPGRVSNALRDATALRLVGLREGSTVLDIAGPDLDDSQMLGIDLPVGLGELSIGMLREGFSALGEGDVAPELPAGYDQALVDDLDEWLRSLAPFETVALESHVADHAVEVKLQPAVARRRLKDANPQAPLPFVNAKQQMLEGMLYALNLNTGTFSIEDVVGHKIRLNVPEEVRRTAATFAGHRVQAIGDAELDERLRLKSFAVSQLDLAPDRQTLSEQTGFFDKHELSPPNEGEIRDSEAWGIEGLSDEESTDFLAALAELR